MPQAPSGPRPTRPYWLLLGALLGRGVAGFLASLTTLVLVGPLSRPLLIGTGVWFVVGVVLAAAAMALRGGPTRPHR